MSCIECGKPAKWVRCTQFAGDHPYCEEHAKSQSDFGENDSYTYWKELKYYTIVFPGECGQHVQETWTEEQILRSAWYKNWVMKVVQADRAYLLEDNQNAINDWIVVHWAIETNQWGERLEEGS